MLGVDRRLRSTWKERATAKALKSWARMEGLINNVEVFVQYQVAGTWYLVRIVE